MSHCPASGIAPHQPPVGRLEGASSEVLLHELPRGRQGGATCLPQP